jgi:alkylation response protein AidB-like acyl-CoA dehydrogenase
MTPTEDLRIEPARGDAIRAEVNSWLDAHWDPRWTVREWWSRLAGAGLAAPGLPVAAGGRGWPDDQALIVDRLMAERGVLGPPIGAGLIMAAPTIATHGTPEQRARFIPPILDGTQAWCQLFSEPGAGSDLAALSAKARLDGDEWVITGQKVWTSLAQYADWGMLLARTDADGPRQRGITYFACDMRQPGVEIRPLREMTGEALFNEVFLDEARIPAANVIGAVNGGWAVARTTLGVERTVIGGSDGHGLRTARPGRWAGQLDELADDVKLPASGDWSTGIDTAVVHDLIAMAPSLPGFGRAAVREGLAELYTLAELSRFLGLRARAGQGLPGADGSLAKLLLSQTVRRVRDVGALLVGPDGMVMGTETAGAGFVQDLTLFSPAPSIYGGTDEIQKNILAERVLRLPREDRPG